ncbi:MAG: hypothetical protein JNK37_23970 [Verrucomicrobiales bacterium]|nr:hypothetical protein [Verrucomicrobiales bacterium]
MPYDPNLPAEGSPLVSAEMRGQLQGLHDLIQTGGISGAQVDSVATLDPGQPASATAGVTGQTLHFTFAIPRGDVGAQGPSFASAQVDAVTSLNPGDLAQASLTFDGSVLRFSFGIPRGFDGSPGTNGADGQPGLPGEVSQAALDAALATTSANSNGVSLLNLFVSDPPTQGELQVVANKIDELIQALRRP